MDKLMQCNVADKEKNYISPLSSYHPFQEQRDLEMKADMAKRLMERGYRVKVFFLCFD